ncbi:MAG: hypothetical protein ACFCUM_14995 [Bacteroidales bacterium]
MAKKRHYFWTSYSDLMTSLFMIMMVLFIMALVLFKSKTGELSDTNMELKKIIERYQQITRLEEQMEPLQEDNGFHYLPNCQKFVISDLMGVEIFEPYRTEIKSQYIYHTVQAGRKIQKFLGSLDHNLHYLLVIEGNMANRWDLSINQDDVTGYTTSYQRALAVYNLWKENGIDFRQYNIEVMLCGSGFNGLCRDEVEDNNKRFSVQIIPKVSHIQMDMQSSAQAMPAVE